MLFLTAPPPRVLLLATRTHHHVSTHVLLLAVRNGLAARNGLPDVPRMPVAAPATGGLDAHRDREPDFVFPFSACVARPVGKKEAAGNPKAQAALL